MAVTYRQCFTLSLFSLSLLSSLSILFSARRINIYRGTTYVLLRGPITGDNPVISNSVRKLKVMGSNITTHVRGWNADTNKQDGSENGYDTTAEATKVLKKLNTGNYHTGIAQEQQESSIIEHVTGTPPVKQTPNYLLREVLGRGRRGQSPGAVWRKRERASDQDTQRLREMFPVSPNLSFPNPQITLPLAVIENTRWLSSLRSHLALLSGQQRKIINLVSSNSQYQDVLLNWLISAVVRSGLELESILVISIDLPLHSRLCNHGIPSVHVPLFQLIHRDTNFTKDFDRVMMLRLAVIRLISHWGFDIHNYDTDAVLLRDPQPLYDQFPGVHMIGSVGRIPTELMSQWGITVCIGVVIIRGSPIVEQYWDAVSEACQWSLDDQERLNCGLEALGLVWHNANDNQNTTVVSGTCRNGLEVKVLPFGDICRLATCDPAQRDSYYIWHKGGSRTRREKVKGSREGRTWFLRYKWSVIKNALGGEEWLKSIAYWQETHS